MHSRLGIAGAHTTVAPEIDEGRDGAHSHQTTPGTDCGGTAGEEENVSDHFSLCLSRSLINPASRSKCYHTDTIDPIDQRLRYHGQKLA